MVKEEGGEDSTKSDMGHIVGVGQNVQMASDREHADTLRRLAKYFTKFQTIALIFSENFFINPSRTSNYTSNSGASTSQGYQFIFIRNSIAYSTIIK